MISCIILIKSDPILNETIFMISAHLVLILLPHFITLSALNLLKTIRGLSS